jgi:hypothetical protein
MSWDARVIYLLAITFSFALTSNAEPKGKAAGLHEAVGTQQKARSSAASPSLTITIDLGNGIDRVQGDTTSKSECALKPRIEGTDWRMEGYLRDLTPTRAGERTVFRFNQEQLENIIRLAKETGGAGRAKVSFCCRLAGATPEGDDDYCVASVPLVGALTAAGPQSKLIDDTYESAGAGVFPDAHFTLSGSITTLASGNRALVWDPQGDRSRAQASLQTARAELQSIRSGRGKVSSHVGRFLESLSAAGDALDRLDQVDHQRKEQLFTALSREAIVLENTSKHWFSGKQVRARAESLDNGLDSAFSLIPR